MKFQRDKSRGIGSELLGDLNGHIIGVSDSGLSILSVSNSPLDYNFGASLDRSV